MTIIGILYFASHISSFFMEELLALRKSIQERDYEEALRLVNDLEEMSKEDKLNKIYSFAVILLVHLIKQQTENRTTTSWELSVRNAVRGIQRTNKRRKAGGHYANREELAEIMTEAYDEALDNACVEIFEGQHDRQYLREKLNEANIQSAALSLVTS